MSESILVPSHSFCASTTFCLVHVHHDPCQVVAMRLLQVKHVVGPGLEMVGHRRKANKLDCDMLSAREAYEDVGFV
jgi:hypothetical protein